MLSIQGLINETQAPRPYVPLRDSAAAGLVVNYKRDVDMDTSIFHGEHIRMDLFIGTPEWVSNQTSNAENSPPS